MGNQTLPFLMTRTEIAAMTHFYYSLAWTRMFWK